MRMKLSLLLLGLSLGGQAADYSAARPGELLQVTLAELHPTQAVVGHDQIHYKLGRFAEERGHLFDEFCEANGQGESYSVPKGADLHRPDSFECMAEVGSRSNEMKTVVIGPAGQLYLTDGHHTFISLLEQPAAGEQLKVWVRVTDNLSDSPDLASFWQQMREKRKVWLKDGNGQSIEPQQLPARLGLDSLGDDPYRALVYFTREVAYDKPRSGEIAPEFLEFYWGDWLRGKLPLSQFDLRDKGDYLEAVERAAKLMVSLEVDSPVGQSGFTARQLGGYQSLDRKEFNKMAGRKLPYVFDSKNRS